jgi:hypothetical protein
MSDIELLTVASIGAAREIRIARGDHPELSDAELIRLLASVDSRLESMPLAPAFELESTLEPGFDFGNFAVAARTLLRRSIQTQPPVWLSAAVGGRTHVIELLTPNEVQLFSAAGLLQSPPDVACLEWWDDLARLYRASADERIMEQARTAERLSLEHEVTRLRSLGIERNPEWVAIDDNSRGYDILSWDVYEGEIASRFVEVKSSARAPMRFYVSRNEWLTAKDLGRGYVIHLWDAKTWSLTEIANDQLAPHIPGDRGLGKWQDAEIRWK